MLIRIKFAKLGDLKFIGHLDTMRYFQKVLFRSALPVRYSEGFNPHPILEFASPLGVGLSSSGEYLDFELTKDLDPAVVEEALKGAFTPGFTFLRLTVLDPRIQGVRKASAMSLVDRADYLLYAEGLEKDVKDHINTAFDKYFSMDSIMLNYETKKGERSFELKENLFGYGKSYDEFAAAVSIRREDEECLIKETDDGAYLYFRVSAGSAVNIRPDTVLDSFLETVGMQGLRSVFAMHRIEMFHNTETGAIPLWAVK